MRMRRQGWEVAYSPMWDGYVVKINGQTVVNEDGMPAIYYPPRHLASARDNDRWCEQICASIERMSGVPCNVFKRRD